MADAPRKMVSVVVPCYNEAKVLEAFLSRVAAVADALPQYAFEFLFIDDGSQDETEELLLRHGRADSRIKLLCLSRNYGHQRAITAGIDRCSGDYVVVIDADLQDPPEVIPEILEHLENGYDLVHTVRSDRRVDSLPKRLSAKLFYMFMRRWILPQLPENASDFKGFNQRVRNALLLYRERVQFLRGTFATLGFKQTQVLYMRAARQAGKSKYSIRNILRLGRDAVISNSALPLRGGLYLGLATWMALPLYALVCLSKHFLGSGLEEPAIALLGGVIIGFLATVLILLGLIGEYLKCIILEVKQRPLYLVRAAHNLEPPP